ncbi:MAG: acyltransferase [Acidobacteria bacterium]|nr:acyltransferase [Acidobacteriota bacterium]
MSTGFHAVYRPLRPMPLAEKLFDRFLGELAEKLDDASLDRNATCRDAIAELYGLSGAKAGAEDERLPLGVRALYASFDPRNITLEPEYYSEIDVARYARVKPLTWLWIMFDRSPLGQNAYLGHRLRRMLAERVFKRCGRNVKIWHFVEYSYGYNLSVGDDVVLHRYAFLDDRGGIELGNKVSVSDYANIYSHTHDINDISTVYLRQTVIEDHVRITYHATVLAGTRVGKDGMIGAMSLATKDAPGHYVSVGIPSKAVRAKDRPCPYCEAEGVSRA